MVVSLGAHARRETENDRRSKEMKAKKQYSKPQLTQVRLTIQNPVLANCNSVNMIFSGWGTCNFPEADCRNVGTFP